MSLLHCVVTMSLLHCVVSFKKLNDIDYCVVIVLRVQLIVDTKRLHNFEEDEDIADTALH